MGHKSLPVYVPGGVRTKTFLRVYIRLHDYVYVVLYMYLGDTIVIVIMIGRMYHINICKASVYRGVYADVNRCIGRRENANICRIHFKLS